MEEISLTRRMDEARGGKKVSQERAAKGVMRTAQEWSDTGSDQLEITPQVQHTFSKYQIYTVASMVLPYPIHLHIAFL